MGNAIKDEKGRWVKGTPSPNPKGRPSLAAELSFIEGIKAGASAETVARLMEMYEEIALNKRHAVSVRMVAARTYLEYAVPKPAATVYTGNLDGSLQDLTDEQIKRILDEHTYPVEDTDNAESTTVNAAPDGSVESTA